MSNSELINYTKISPNKTSPRNHIIDTITIHCYVGQTSVYDAGSYFAKPTTEASANYVIGTDGKVALIVDEKDRSWCSSNADNDNRAVTIECASDSKPPYAINHKVYTSLIKLCADICIRNGIKELKWKNDKSLIGDVEKQNITVHRWFAAKDCPGDYIFNRLGSIATAVNKLINNNASTKSIDDVVEEVIAGKWGNYPERKTKLEEAGYDYYAVQREVDSLLNVKVEQPVKTTKSIQDLAIEVLAGKWGNYPERKTKLEEAGYDYYAVQRKVNEFLTGDYSTAQSKSVDEIAQEVIAGKWGNYPERKTKLEEAGYNYDSVQNRVNELLK